MGNSRWFLWFKSPRTFVENVCKYLNLIFANYISELTTEVWPTANTLPSKSVLVTPLLFLLLQKSPYFGGDAQVPERRLRGGAGKRRLSRQSPQNAER